MKCPECGSKAVVIDSRCDGSVTYRRLECEKCANRFTTIEKIMPGKIGLKKSQQLQMAIKKKMNKNLTEIKGAIAELERIYNEQ